MTVYAAVTDLNQLGIAAAALSDVSVPSQNAMLGACSARIDDALARGGRYTPPLSTWSASITLVVCKLAQYELIGVEGFSPDTATEQEMLRRYQQAEAWLAEVASGAALAGIVDTAGSSDIVEELPQFDSATTRGWDDTSTTNDDGDTW